MTGIKFAKKVAMISPKASGILCTLSSMYLYDARKLHEPIRAIGMVAGTSGA